MWKFQTLALPELPLLLFNFVIWLLNYPETNSASPMIVHFGVFLKASFASGGKRNTHLLFKYPGCNLHAIHGWKRVEIDWLVTLCDRYEPYGLWYKIIVNSVKWTTSGEPLIFPQGVVDRVKREHVWKSSHSRKARCGRVIFMRACISLALPSLRKNEGLNPSLIVKWNMNQWSKLEYFQHHLLVL